MLLTVSWRAEQLFKKNGHYCKLYIFLPVPRKQNTQSSIHTLTDLTVGISGFAIYTLHIPTIDKSNGQIRLTVGRQKSTAGPNLFRLSAFIKTTAVFRGGLRLRILRLRPAARIPGTVNTVYDT